MVSVEYRGMFKINTLPCKSSVPRLPKHITPRSAVTQGCSEHQPAWSAAALPHE